MLNPIRELYVLTNTLLGPGASYTSVTLDGLQFMRITGAVSSDQSGTLYIDESDDGNTWVNAIATQAITGGTPAGYNYVIHVRYVRVRYVNGGTSQTNFSLSGYLCIQ